MTKYLMDFVFDNYLSILAGSIIVVLLGTVAAVALYDRRASIKKYFEHRRELRIQRGMTMGRKAKADRQAYVKGLLADVITNGLENAWFEGKINQEERDACYRMIGKTHGIPDLLPHMSQAALKSVMKKRKSLGLGPTAGPVQEQPAWGDPPPVPKKSDDQPPSVATNVVQAAKRFGDKALKRLPKTA